MANEGYIVNMESKQSETQNQAPKSNNNNLLSKIIEFFKKTGNWIKLNILDRVIWAADRVVGFVKQQNKTKPLRRKLVVWTLSIIGGLVSIIIIVFGIGLYKFDWQDKFTNKLIRIVPYPAAISSNSWITMYQFRKEYGYIENYAKASSIPILSDKKEIQDQVLEQLISRQILQREAPKYGIKVSKKEIDDEYAKLVAMAKSEDELLSTIYKTYGMNKKDFRSLLSDQILISKVMSELPLRVNVQQIFLVNDSKGNKNKEAEILVRANEILTRAKKGENFGALAKQFSQDTKTKDKKGELGWVTRGSVVVCDAKSKEFEDAVLKMNVGEIGGPVKTACGFHIVKINDKQGWVDQTYEEWLNGLRQKTKVWKVIE